MSRLRSRLRFRIDDESHLRTIADSSLPLWGVGILVVAIVTIGIFCGGLLVMITPLKQLLPGYLKEDQRDATEESLLRLDSIIGTYETNSRYIENFLRATDTDRLPTDSIPKIDTILETSTEDSLIGPSERERNFVARMQEHERFNVSVLAPLAADGMIFTNVTDNGIFSSSTLKEPYPEVILASGANVKAMTDGTVVDAAYSSPKGCYSMAIQHRGGFLSYYSGLGSPLVDIGEKVSAGQIIASPPSPDANGRRIIRVRLWHNGIHLIPYDYIGKEHSTRPDRQIEAENSFTAPRGR